jgi:hypothetical protein
MSAPEARRVKAPPPRLADPGIPTEPMSCCSQGAGSGNGVGVRVGVRVGVEVAVRVGVRVGVRVIVGVPVTDGVGVGPLVKSAV